MSTERFTSRWSRLKQQDREDKQKPVEEEEQQQALLEQQHEQVNQLTDADMPALESLNESSDFSMFMSEKVSESVRKMALRKMFHMPAFNVLDGLNDYDDDYTVFEPLGEMITHDMKRMARLDAEREEQKQAEAEASAHIDEAQTPSIETNPNNNTEQASETQPLTAELDEEFDFDDGDVEDI